MLPGYHCFYIENIVASKIKAQAKNTAEGYDQVKLLWDVLVNLVGTHVQMPVAMMMELRETRGSVLYYMGLW